MLPVASNECDLFLLHMRSPRLPSENTCTLRVLLERRRRYSIGEAMRSSAAFWLASWYHKDMFN